jgi:hypothetical protein
MKTEANNTNIKGHRRHRRWHKLSGMLLAVVGLFWLARNVGWIPVAAGGSPIIWPVLTIMFGLWLVFDKRGVTIRDEK